jgi:hypothetical protein
LLKRIRPLGQWVKSAADFVESRPLTAAAAIFALAFTIRLLFLFGTSTWPDEKNYEMTRVAMSVAAGEGYSNPFAPARTGPSAHIAPAYATVLAGVYRVFGTGQTGDLVKQLLSCVISSLVYALLPAIAVAAGLARHIGFFAGLLGALAPVSIEVEVIGRWEAHFSTLLFVLAVWLWFRHFRSGEFSFRSGAFAGVVWGVLLLTAPAFVLVLSSLVLLLMAQRKYRTRRVAAYVASLALVLILVITPWTIRNVRQFGTMFFIRNNAGLEFYVSNLPGAKLMLHDNMLGIGKSVHPFTEPTVCQRVAEIGELAFNRECMANFQGDRQDRYRALRFPVFPAVYLDVAADERAPYSRFDSSSRFVAVRHQHLRPDWFVPVAERIGLCTFDFCDDTAVLSSCLLLRAVCDAIQVSHRLDHLPACSLRSAAVRDRALGLSRAP